MSPNATTPGLTCVIHDRSGDTILSYRVPALFGAVEYAAVQKWERPVWSPDLRDAVESMWLLGWENCSLMARRSIVAAWPGRDELEQKWTAIWLGRAWSEWRRA